MVQEAEKFAKDDQVLKDTIESKNQLEGLIYQTRSSLSNKDMCAKLDDSDLTQINALLTEVDEWLLQEGLTKSDYDTKLNELNGQLQPLLMKAMSQGSEGFAAQEAVPPTIDEID